MPIRCVCIQDYSQSSIHHTVNLYTNLTTEADWIKLSENIYLTVIIIASQSPVDQISHLLPFTDKAV
jgi:hypothetical protein